MEKEYQDNFDCSKDLKVSLDWQVKIYAYTDTSEYADKNGKWIHADPRKMVLSIEDIFYFRDQTENDRWNNEVMTIMDSTIMPTKWCMMVYHDNWDKKQHIVPVVGKADEMNKYLDSLKKQYYEQSNILRKLHNDIKNLYLNYTE